MEGRLLVRCYWLVIVERQLPMPQPAYQFCREADRMPISLPCVMAVIAVDNEPAFDNRLAAGAVAASHAHEITNSYAFVLQYRATLAVVRSLFRFVNGPARLAPVSFYCQHFHRSPFLRNYRAPNNTSQGTRSQRRSWFNLHRLQALERERSAPW